MRTPGLRLGAAALLLSTVGACGDDPVMMTTATAPHGLFELAVLDATADPTLDFFALPYPNDLRLDPDGSPALARYARPGASALAGFVDTIDKLGHGFGPGQAAYLRFDAPIDTSKLPDEAGSLADDAAAFLVDVTPGGAHHGERLPVRLQFNARHIDFIGDDWLVMQPVPGIGPRDGATYAVVVTDQIALPAPALERVLADAPQGAAETRAAAVYAPLRAWLDEHPAHKGHVGHATVYTVTSGAKIMDELRTAVLATPQPSLSQLAYSKSATSYDLYTGRYDSPNFQEGQVPYSTMGGAIHRGSDGKPEPVRTESLRVAMSIPKGPMPVGGWPVVLYAHGTGGDYLSFVSDGTASRLAVVKDRSQAEIAHMAVVSIDQVLHGDRVPAGTDPQLSFFNINNLVAARDNPKQGALDDFQLLRFVKGVDVAAAPTTGAPIRFDASHVYFFGHSQGSLTGSLFVAAEPEVKAAVFSGAGAGLVAALLLKTKPVDISAVVQAFFSEPADDFHPFLNLLQGFFDESDPGSYVRRFFVEPPAGMAAKNVFVSLGLRDSYTPVPTIEAFALGAGVVPVKPALLPIDDLALTGRSFADAPQADNVAGGTTTGVLCEYDPGGHDGHFVVFDVQAAADQSTRFLATHAQAGVARLDPP